MARYATMTVRSAAGTLAALAIASLGGAGVALACSLVPPPLVRGVLGRGLLEARDAPVPVPPNVASLGPLQAPGGAPIATVPVDALRFPGLRRPAEPLAPGAEVVSPDDPCCAPAVVEADVPDVTPPSRPEIRSAAVRRVGAAPERVGCQTAEDSCSDVTTLTIALDPAVDDRAPPERVTYALWIGDGPDVGDGASPPDVLQLSELAGGATRELVRYASDEELERDLWLRVVALDQAGNASTPSEPYLLRGDPGGCRVQAGPPRRRLADLGVVAAAVALAVARRRRAVRRRARRAVP